MIEFFAIFGKGGLVLWYFNEGRELFKDAVNTLISEVLLQVHVPLLTSLINSIFSNATFPLSSKTALL
jgi:hypothetical protein